MQRAQAIGMDGRCRNGAGPWAGAYLYLASSLESEDAATTTRSSGPSGVDRGPVVWVAFHDLVATQDV